jgi:hypothetical protein
MSGVDLTALDADDLELVAVAREAPGAVWGSLRAASGHAVPAGRPAPLLLRLPAPTERRRPVGLHPEITVARPGHPTPRPRRRPHLGDGQERSDPVSGSAIDAYRQFEAEAEELLGHPEAGEDYNAKATALIRRFRAVAKANRGALEREYTRGRTKALAERTRAIREEAAGSATGCPSSQAAVPGRRPDRRQGDAGPDRTAARDADRLGRPGARTRGATARPDAERAAADAGRGGGRW